LGSNCNEKIRILAEHGINLNNICIKRGFTALHLAVMKQLPASVIKLLLDLGSIPDILSNQKLTALHIASKIKNNVFTVRTLLQYKSDVNIRTYFGYTPLHYGVISDDISIVKELLENGADLSIHRSKISMDDSAITLSKNLGRWNILNLLLEKEKYNKMVKSVEKNKKKSYKKQQKAKYFFEDYSKLSLSANG